MQTTVNVLLGHVLKDELRLEMIVSGQALDWKGREVSFSWKLQKSQKMLFTSITKIKDTEFCRTVAL